MNLIRMSGRLLAGLVMAAVTMLSMPERAEASGGSLDYFGTPRTVQLVAPTVIIGNAANALTGSPVDVRMFDGVAQVDVFCLTKAAGGTLTATLQGSPDTTTWTSISNFAAASSTTVIYTNLYYGTNGLTATNTWLLPGTIVTPTAATAGWATPYLFAAPFTNAAGAYTLTPNAWTSFGVNIEDAPRYFRVVFTPGGTLTNCNVGAILLGRVHAGPGAP
jgi:hypothetical protein